jgi:predicted choloylglycine hydrolase
MNNVGCQEAYSAYYQYNPQVIADIKLLEKSYKDAAGPVITNYGLPVVSALITNKINLSIDKNLFLEYNQENYKIIFRRSF